jgi:hypothetical protein
MLHISTSSGKQITCWYVAHKCRHLNRSATSSATGAFADYLQQKQTTAPQPVIEELVGMHRLA